MVPARGRDHDRHGPADGPSLAVADARAAHGGELRVADAGVLRLVHGEPDAPDVDRGRRDAHLRDCTPASRAHGRRDGDHPARAGPRRGGHGAARRDRVRARHRHLRRERVPLARGALRPRHVRADLPLLLPLGAPTARPDAPAAPAAQGRTTDACLLRRRPPLPRARPPARGRVRVHDRHPGSAGPFDLGRGEGRRDRARPADLLRDGARSSSSSCSCRSR